MLLRSPHILSMSDLNREEIESIFQTTDTFREVGGRPIKKVPALRGKTVINLFFENSTRTRTSFEIAGKRLSADVINISKSSSSVSKGESLLDTVKNLMAMSPDILVVRHPAAGAPQAVARVLDKTRIINAGDGAHEHPTQALLDLLTIRDHKKKIEGLHVGIVGDIAHSRVARSNIGGLKTFGAKVTVIGPKSMIPSGIAGLGVGVSYDLAEVIPELDVIMMLRIQSERLGLRPFPSLREYSRAYGLNLPILQRAKPDVVIMHPGPVNRGVEISPEVADGPFSLILDQVKNGVAVRMALLYLLAGEFAESEA
ncbi:MAG TPA: aspartate carbamoyltransferase [Deltaproteobacteria bacterium]|nr:aspartate carbamoyltransferase [Deltaproteobacteria bacterium]